MTETRMVRLIELRGQVRERRAAIIRNATELAVDAIAFEDEQVSSATLAAFIDKHGLEGVTLDIENPAPTEFGESLHSVMERFGWKSTVSDPAHGGDPDWDYSDAERSD